MKRTAASKTTIALATAALLGGGVAYMATADDHDQQKWEVHDMKRPRPPVIQPATFPTPEAPGKAPSDALVLFGGTDLSHWQSAKGGDAKWKVASGYMEVGGGDVQTKESFGDCQLHVEWASPT